ncbi:MAG: hypothetical protein ACOCN9_01740 [Prevotella sp.]
MSSEIKRCYLTAVLAEEGTKVTQVCVDRNEYPLPPLPSAGARSILKQQRIRWVTMACSLEDTVIDNSVMRRKNIEQLIRSKKALDEEKCHSREQAKIMRWYGKRNEKWKQQWSNDDGTQKKDTGEMPRM